MVILDKRSIILPLIEKEKFIRLLRLGLEYNRDTRRYRINNYDRINEIIDTLSNILNDEVIFLQNCNICKKVFPCSECKYIGDCSTKNLPFECVCTKCLMDDSVQQRIL